MANSINPTNSSPSLFFSEIDDVQPGTIVYVPYRSGSIHLPEGQTTKYVKFVATSYYKRGFEDRMIVSGDSGETRIRYDQYEGCWMSYPCKRPLSSVPVETEWGRTLTA